jgi:hypothetical protein
MVALIALAFVAIVALIPPGGSGFLGRYLFPVLPLVAWVAGSPLAQWGRLRARSRLLIVVGLTGYLGATFMGYAWTFQRIQPYREAIALIQAQSCPTAVVAANSLGKSFVQYYDRQIVPLSGPSHLLSLLRTNREVWVLSTYEGFRSSLYSSDVATQRMIEDRMLLEETLDGQQPVSVWRTAQGGRGCARSEP